MKVQVIIDLNIDGTAVNYETTYKNLDAPGEPMDYTVISKALRLVVPDMRAKVIADSNSGETGQARRDFH